MITYDHTPRCRICGTSDLSRLLRAEETGGLHGVTYICRPETPNRRCWYRSARPRSIERIELLIPISDAQRARFLQAHDERRQPANVGEPR